MNNVHIEYRPLKYVRGWPTPSQRPYLLFLDGAYVSAHTTVTKAKENARKRGYEVG